MFQAVCQILLSALFKQLKMCTSFQNLTGIKWLSQACTSLMNLLCFGINHYNLLRTCKTSLRLQGTQEKKLIVIPHFGLTESIMRSYLDFSAENSDIPLHYAQTFLELIMGMPQNYSCIFQLREEEKFLLKVSTLTEAQFSSCRIILDGLLRLGFHCYSLKAFVRLEEFAWSRKGFSHYRCALSHGVSGMTWQ